MTASLNRVLTLLLRHSYLYRQSWPRVAGLIVWPAVNMLSIGFLNRYLTSARQGAASALTPGGGVIVFGVLLAGMMLWDWFVRAKVGTMMALMEEVWSRNLGQLFVTPLHDGEYILSLCCIGLFAVCASMIPVMLAAWLCFGFSMLSLGLPLALLLGNLLIFGWSFGLLAATLVLRFGQSAEWVVWPLPFLIFPLAAVYYPVSVLPHMLQYLSWAIPATYSFEGMRGVMDSGLFPASLFLRGFGLNILYAAGAIAIFRGALSNSRQRGALLQVGE